MLSSSNGPHRPVRSMTGFASVTRETDAGELTVSLRSVNHRGLDLHFHQGHEFACFENEMRSLLKRGISRAHVDVRVSLSRAIESGSDGFNLEALRAYVVSFQRVSEHLNLDGKPDLNRLISLPGVVGTVSGSQSLPEDFGGQLLAALSDCLAVYNATREREGETLRAAIAELAAEIEIGTKEILQLRAEAIPQFRQRLHQKLRELLGETGISEARLAEEAALLADRSDIHEELTRLLLHAKELQNILRRGGETGKRLDFLLQELNRETNTTLAKSTNAGEPGLRITQIGLTLKANIERIREQALNLE